MPKRLENAEKKLSSLKEQLRLAEEDVKKPFAKEEEYRQKTARLAELDSMLCLDGNIREAGTLEEGE